ncbi:MAG: flavodoxin family protein [Candidatus Bathyarchaeota archaeon]|nr:flavodoxin family protein [Candidatus Bathyarchaeota archaeon]
MKALGIVGSPRKNGNTDILVSEVLRGAKDSGSKVEMVFLNDLEIKPCQAICSDYCKRTSNCKIKDDMTDLYNKLFESEVIILGTPVYWYGPSAQFKAFMDRWYAFSHPKYILKMRGKKFILIAPFEESDTSAANPLVEMVDKSANYLDAKFHSSLLVSVGEKGAIKQNLEAMNRAYKIGQEIK